MNNILKAAARLNYVKTLFNPARTVLRLDNKIQQRQFARNLWYLTNARNDNLNFGIKLGKFPEGCACGCGKHTKAESELVQFLTEEILEERKAQKSRTIPTELDGFKAQLNGSEVTLTKDDQGEKVKITFNVNHTLDTEAEPQINPEMDKPELGELKSKPAFKVDITRGETTVSLMCSFINPEEQDEGYNDIYGIDEVSIYDGEWNEHVYSVSGEVLESFLYDLLLNYMEEKGISNEFVEKLSEYSTAYEHSAYIGFLEGLSKFVSRK